MSKDQISIRDSCYSFGPLVPARYVSRLNRFLIQTKIADKVTAAYLANPGRLQELLVPGRSIWLRPASNPHRKTAYDAVLIQHPNSLVSLDSHLPNILIHRALCQGALSDLYTHDHVRREVSRGTSRLDFCLANSAGQLHWVEAKSVTLVEQGIAGFPDAPTQRGRRHLRELQDAVRSGDEASVIFVIQRGDAIGFKPHDATDPAFGSTLREVTNAGVMVHAFRCQVTHQSICLDRSIPINLDAPTPSDYNPSRST